MKAFEHLQQASKALKGLQRLSKAPLVSPSKAFKGLERPPKAKKNNKKNREKNKEKNNDNNF